MSLIPSEGLAEAAIKLVDKFVPDKDEAAKMKAKFEELKLAGDATKLEYEFKLLIAQIDVNKVDASSQSKFQSWWRPAVGWAGVTGLMYSFLAHPFLSWVSLMYDKPMPPTLDMSVLMTLLTGILGLGIARSFEKVKGVA